MLGAGGNVKALQHCCGELRSVRQEGLVLGQRINGTHDGPKSVPKIVRTAHARMKRGLLAKLSTLCEVYDKALKAAKSK